jgi:hypothetical protein
MSPFSSHATFISVRLCGYLPSLFPHELIECLPFKMISAVEIGWSPLDCASAYLEGAKHRSIGVNIKLRVLVEDNLWRYSHVDLMCWHCLSLISGSCETHVSAQKTKPHFAQ